MKPCTIVVTNAKLKQVSSQLRGKYVSTELRIVITDDETGRVINRHTVSSGQEDTVTFKAFYDETQVEENAR